MKISSALDNWLKQRQHNHCHRQLLVISGQQHWCVAQAEHVLEYLNAINSLWVGSTTQARFRAVNAAQYKPFLGQETDHLVFDAHLSTRANVLMGLSGCIKSEGLMILLCPEFQHWPTEQTQDLAQLFSYQQLPKKSHFVSWLMHNIQTDPKVALLTETHFKGEVATFNPVEKKVELPYKSTEQQQAVEAILKVVNGHRKRPLVLTADRGRGKSSALGIAAAQLIQAGKQIVITAPSLAQTEQVFIQAAANTPDCTQQKRHLLSEKGSLRFIAVDALSEQLPTTDLLMIDEAAAIPAPLLMTLAKHYSRMVLSSTVHGYEGSGRGFELRLLPFLAEQQPEYRHIQLSSPIRWQNGDALEEFWFTVFLMQAPPLSASSDYPLQQVKLKQLPTSVLIQQPKILIQCFQLLINAHYQTTQEDLARLLDAPEQSLIVALHKQRVVAVALCATEGGDCLTPLAEPISNGNRRVRGHLLAQSLALHSGDSDWAHYRYLRILRIAVLPEWQNKGIGSQLLDYICQQTTDVDFIGSAFGASDRLVRFWQKSGFSAIHLGNRKDASSGEYSLQVLKHCSTQCEGKINIRTEDFMRSLLFQTPQYFQSLSSSLLAMLFVQRRPTPLSQPEQQQLRSYLSGNKPYTLIEPTLQKLLLNALPQQQTGYELLIALLLQRHSKQQLFTTFNLHTNSALQNKIKQLTAALVQENQP